MIVNIHMDMVDRVCSYPFEAMFNFEFDNEDVLRRGIECLNGTNPDEWDAITEPGWEMCQKLLSAANTYLIQHLPRTAPSEVREIVDDMLEYDYDKEYFYGSNHSDFKQIIKQLNHYQGVIKRIKSSSAKYWEYTNKIADVYSQILQYDYNNYNEILFDCEGAVVIEWEDEKARTGEFIPTDLERVKKMTKGYIRCFDLDPVDRFGSVRHPVATSLMMHHPQTTSSKFCEELPTLLTSNKLFYNLAIPSEREEWYAVIDSQIDAAESLEDLYMDIIRGNWLDSWKGFIKEFLSYTDRQTISKAYSEHMEWINQERDRLFGDRNMD